MSKVLVLTPEFPWPPNSGSRIREYQTVRALARRYDVTVVSLADGDVAERGLARFRELGVEVRSIEHARSKPEALVRMSLSRQPYRVAKFANEEFSRAVASALADDEFDLVWVHFLNTTTALPDGLDVPVVLDQHNEEVEYWESFRDGSVPEALFARINQRRTRRLQRSVAGTVDAVLSVSESDADETESWVGETPVFVVPNGVDTDQCAATKPASSRGKRVLFVGSLDVRMNEEALTWFVEAAWPRVREAHPSARFHVVGRGATDAIRSLGREDGVRVVGEVDDVVPHYDDAAVVVAPFQFGGGTKLKILEALAMERGLVSTPKGVHGIDVTDGDECVIAPRDDRFGEEVATLLDEPTERDRLGSTGRKLVESRYSWQTILEDANDAVADLFDLSERARETSGN